MRTLAQCICFAFASMTFQDVYADVYNPKIVLGPFAGKIEIGPRMNATGHRLWGSEIVGQDLRNACFDDCDLNGVIFRQCIFHGATFRRAVLAGMTIDDCEWGDNVWDDAVINGVKPFGSSDSLGLTPEALRTTHSYKNKDLSRCIYFHHAAKPLDFSGFDLTDAALHRISRCSFANAKLVKTLFYQGDLTECAFDGAKLANCHFKFCKLDYSRLRRSAEYITGADLEYVELVSDADLSDLRLIQKQLTHTGTGRVLLANSFITGMTLNGLDSKQLAGTRSYKAGDLSRCEFHNCDFSDCDFSGQLLVATRFWRCNLSNCNFTNAVLTHAVFEECSGLTAEQMKTTWDYQSRHKEKKP